MNTKTLIITVSMLLTLAQAKAENYTLLVYENQEALKLRFDKDKAKMDAYWNEFNQFAAILQQAKVLRSGKAFKTASDIKTVTIKGEKVEVKDVAYAKSKEVLGGIYMIDVPDLETAISYAKKATSRTGITIEVLGPQENPTRKMKK